MSQDEKDLIVEETSKKKTAKAKTEKKEKTVKKKKAEEYDEFDEMDEELDDLDEDDEDLDDLGDLDDIDDFIVDDQLCADIIEIRIFRRPEFRAVDRRRSGDTDRLASIGADRCFHRIGGRAAG